MLQCRNAEHCRRFQSPPSISSSKMPGIDRDVGTAAALKPTVSSFLSSSVPPCLSYASAQERMMLALHCRRAQYLKRTLRSLC